VLALLLTLQGRIPTFPAGAAKLTTKAPDRLFRNPFCQKAAGATLK
jgi:hypothetical protein